MKKITLPGLFFGILVSFLTILCPYARGQGAMPNPAATQIIAEENFFWTASNAVFSVPKNWFVTNQNGFYLLQDPDRALSLALVEVEETDGLNAINKAWKTFHLDFSLQTAQTKNIPGQNGWDGFYTASYWVADAKDITRADENRRVWASARKKGDIWYVFLFDGDKAAADRRDAQIGLIMGGLKTPGPSVKTQTVVSSMEPGKLKLFEDFLRQAMDGCGIPGAAVAIVQNGNIIYEKGFGVREAGKKDPVTPKTLFSIGSTTKPLTTLLMARLVDAGKITWDTPVTQLMPNFQTADTEMTKNLTLKETVCACTGLPRQDMEMIFQGADTTPEQVLEKMRVMAPTTGFGETFQYSNIMVAAGGYIAAHAADPSKPLGEAYNDAMQSYVFTPLGMKDTTLDFSALPQKEVASPHGRTMDMDYTPIPLSDDDWTLPYRPAAGVWSTADDMAKYVLMELAAGLGPDGTRIVSKENLFARREPQVKMSEFSEYGLGMIISKEDGLRIYDHGGNTTGYTCAMVFLPKHGIGMVLLTNADHADLFTHVVRRKLMELLTDKTDSRAQEELDSGLHQMRENYETAKTWLKRLSGESWIYDFAGDYMNEYLGKVSLRMTQSGGVFDTGKWQSSVADTYNRNGEVKFYLTAPPLTLASFTADDQDGHKTLTYETPQKKYIFQQVPQGPGK